MKNYKSIFQKIFFSICVLLSFISCTNDEIRLKQSRIEIPTEVNGNIKDYITNANISGFKIEVERSCDREGYSYRNSEIVGSAITNSNGNYSIKFNHFLRSHESNVSYDIVYSREYNSSNDEYYVPSQSTTNLIKPGEAVTINLIATKRTELELTLDVLNNNNAPLSVSVSNLNMSWSHIMPSITQQNTTAVFKTTSVPDEDLRIQFYYFTIINDVRIRHEKIVYYHTTLDPVDRLNYTVDCSTF